MKKQMAFDLDGTLAENKCPLDAEMTELFTSLLGIVKVAVISGGAWPQFEKQVLTKMPHHAQLEQLSILPTSGTKYYQFVSEWKVNYREYFGAFSICVRNPEENKRVIEAIIACLSDKQNTNTTDAI